MKQYLELLNQVLETGVDKLDRTGVGTRSLFGAQMRFNMADGFPAVTTKSLALKSVIVELLWFISGSSDITKLQSQGVHIWDANAKAPYWLRARFEGDIGRVYGPQWRAFGNVSDGPIDQLAKVIDSIKNDPNSRRHLVTAWNPQELEDMALPPCHVLFQFYVANGKLSLQLYQRSADMFLGVPFNIASYSLLLHMVAQVTGLKPGEFVHTLGDAHIYRNHFGAVIEQLARAPMSLPVLWLNPKISKIDDFRREDVEIQHYQHHPAIKAPMAV